GSGRDRDRRAIPSSTFSAQERLDSSVRAASNCDSRCVNERQTAQVIEARQLIVKLFGLQLVNGDAIGFLPSAGITSAIDLIDDVRTLGSHVSAAYRREEDIAGFPKHGRHAIELPCRGLLAAVVP